jgi:hypothetical protein
VRLSDGRGLYLEISPTGGKWWRFKYRLAGKEKRISLGVYPDVPLAAAREKREEARRQFAAGSSSIFSPGSARDPSKRSRHRSCWRSCGKSNRAERTRLRTAVSRCAAAYSVSLLRPAVPNAIRHGT